MASKTKLGSWITVIEKPLLRRRILKGRSGYLFSEERTFESDSGYDANCRDRLIAMAKGAAGRLVVEGVVMEGCFPDFDPKNRMRLTVEILPPEGEIEPDAE